MVTKPRSSRNDTTSYVRLPKLLSIPDTDRPYAEPSVNFPMLLRALLFVSLAFTRSSQPLAVAYTCSSKPPLDKQETDSFV
jgi:hypothetical protein